jgi:hypothetical protein
LRIFSGQKYCVCFCQDRNDLHNVRVKRKRVQKREKREKLPQNLTLSFSLFKALHNFQFGFWVSRFKFTFVIAQRAGTLSFSVLHTRAEEGKKEEKKR